MKLLFRNAFLILTLQLLSLQTHAMTNKKGSYKTNADPIIASKTIKVTLDSSFPRIIQYNWIANGNVLYGQEDQLSQVLINGTLYKPKTTFSIAKNTANYVLDIAEIKVLVKVQIKVVSNIVEFNGFCKKLTNRGFFCWR